MPASVWVLLYVAFFVLVTASMLALFRGDTLSRAEAKQDKDERRIARALDDIRNLTGCVAAFRRDMGRFPTVSEGLDVLQVPPSDFMKWKGPYGPKGTQLDPWGRPYHYSVPVPSYPGSDRVDSSTVVSYGADGVPGGEGVDADIFDWDID